MDAFDEIERIENILHKGIAGSEEDAANAYLNALIRLKNRSFILENNGLGSPEYYTTRAVFARTIGDFFGNGHVFNTRDLTKNFGYLRPFYEIISSEEGARDLGKLAFEKYVKSAELLDAFWAVEEFRRAFVDNTRT